MSLVEYTNFYPKNPSKPNKRTRPHIIHYVRYNPHTDHENFCREKLMLYVPFRNSENSLLVGHQSWSSAFEKHKIQIARNEKMFTSLIDSKWGDIDEATTQATDNNDLTKDLGIDHT